jgi:hypothetical protein
MDPAELTVRFSPVTELRSAHLENAAGDYIHLLHDGEIVLRLRASDFKESPTKALKSLRSGLTRYLSGDWKRESSATRIFLARAILAIDDKGQWIALQDERGEEIVYWASEEFSDDPHDVIGALMGAIARHQPSNLSDFPR